VYIDSIKINNLRTFKSSKVKLLHPRINSEELKLPKPKLPNVNLLLGDNGSGKSSLLMAIALAALGPAVDRSGIYPHSLVRRDPTKNNKKNTKTPENALIEAKFSLHPQDIKGSLSYEPLAESRLIIERKGELEGFISSVKPEDLWEPIFSSKTDAFFFVGYGATRRVEPGESLDMGARTKSKFARAQRIQGLFEDSYSLIPLTYWLPKLKSENKGRYVQVKDLINRLIHKRSYKFEGDMEGGNYLFERSKFKIPFNALSDGYRAFLGWVGDLLYHICYGCPPGVKLIENHGIVMVDEIDLHLHPRWQMEVIRTISRALPNIQFIFTSHSPLITGSLEWMNILYMKTNPKMSTNIKRISESIHGKDADQILLSDYFGLSSTRVSTKQRRINNLTLKARSGDHEAAKKLLSEMTKGMEEIDQE